MSSRLIVCRPRHFALPAQYGSICPIFIDCTAFVIFGNIDPNLVGICCTLARGQLDRVPFSSKSSFKKFKRDEFNFFLRCKLSLGYYFDFAQTISL